MYVTIIEIHSELPIPPSYAPGLTSLLRKLLSVLRCPLHVDAKHNIKDGIPAKLEAGRG